MTELFILAIFAICVVAWKYRQRVRHDRQHQSKLEQNTRDGIKAPPSLHPFIAAEHCIGCGSCVAACPEQGVLGLVNMKARLLQPDHCVGHGKCELACPVGAISLVLGAGDNGVEVPVTDEAFQTRVPGVYVVGELGGIGLIRNSMLQGMQCLAAIAKQPHRREGDYDVIIVGAGPAGLGATLQAQAHKLRYLTLEQDDIGGTILKFPRRKVVMTAPLNLPGYGEIYFREVVKEDLLVEWEKIIQKAGVKIHTKKRVDKILLRENSLDVMVGQERFRTANVVLALGRRGTPRKLGVPGEGLSKVIYQLDDPQEFAGRKCLVVGGGDSAIECALMLAEAGAHVALSYRQNSISRVKPRNRQLFDEALQRRRIRALMPSVVKEIMAQTVRLETKGAEIKLPNDDVIIMAGGVLPFEFLKEIGIEMRTLYGEPLPGRKILT